MSIEELKSWQSKLKEAFKKVLAYTEKIVKELFKNEKPGAKKDKLVKEAQAKEAAVAMKNSKLAKALAELKSNKLKIKTIRNQNFQDVKKMLIPIHREQ